MRKVDYAGCLIVVDGNTLILQKRDNIIGISNPGMVTTFGGRFKEGEGPKEALKRELREELEVDVPADDMFFLAYVERFDVENQYIVGCWFYVLELDFFEGAICNEGAIVRVPVEKAEKVERIGPICLELISRFKLYKLNGMLC